MPPRASLHPRPLTLWLGLGIIIACMGLLFADLWLASRGPLHTQEQVLAVLAAEPRGGAFGRLARWIAINMTAIVWAGYVLFLEGVLTHQQGRSPLRRRPNHFATLCLASVIIWCIFDTINFYSIGAWDYLGIPPNFLRRLWSYMLAFGAIVPAMLMSGQVLMNLGWFDFARSPGWRMPAWGKWVSIIAGAAMILWPLVHPDPVTNLTLWMGLIFLLDPINLSLGRPSMFRDWQAGWYGRTLAAFAGGLVCGLLWEFWNYWALAKWVYDLPFLGPLENIRYFEMPLLGLLGFIPFGLQCWVMWQMMRIPLDGLAEPLPDDRTLL